MNIEYFISDKQVERDCITFLNPSSAFYDKKCKALIYKNDMLIKLHRIVNFDAFILSLDFDSFVETLSIILSHETFHNECRKENIKYNLHEEIIIYKVTEDLNNEEIKFRMLKKIMYIMHNKKKGVFIRRIKGWLVGNTSSRRLTNAI